MDILLEQLKALNSNDEYLITTLSNTSSFLYHNLPDLNWVGFYFFIDNKLVLGPFQGKPACQTITLDRGVCGKCATTKQTLLVNDVHKFKDHIACDSASNSEIVLPILINNSLYALLDIDSPILNRFTQQDKELLELVVDYLQETIPQRK